ncbi:M14 family metallopeptidase [Shewanella inventionis]|uniref:Peptidase n=1 Tax=Shewanella inventionis TaxID=1738770 RepID=A0ABQ1J753_9GAMM|nr:M14 family metallocarboxypeptidase [Shewanella inventionis]MCL1159192.1 M14 family metallocarboxypeptidase [Shewanella inventionis]GGB61663.1 peptidase [Shewanella inventionis]
MTQSTVYPIGTPGQKWTDADKAQWLAQVTIKRSYQDEVVSKLTPLANQFEQVQYGALSYDADKYPLFGFKSPNWDRNKKTILVTGGVHGYETSGVHGAIQFLATKAEHYSQYFNIAVAPCVSPWGYETINRWNPKAIDPNRSFYANSPAEESANLMAFVATLGEVYAHIDLHETTDTDELEFRPLLSARDGVEYEKGIIPDGFYLVGDSDNPTPEFQKAIIDAVAKVTHIAPDDNGQLIEVPIEQFGVINYPVKKLSLCAGITNNHFNTTTEVYPDSPHVTEQQCNDAQVAAITGGLDYILNYLKA